MRIAAAFIPLLLAAAAPATTAATTDGAQVRPVRDFVTMRDGTRLYYERYGNGPNVVIAPGALFLADDFKRLAAPDRTLIFYDMRDRGRSDAVRDTNSISIVQDKDDLEEVRRQLGIERFSLIGYSGLSYWTALYVAEHPRRVLRFIQMGPVSPKFGTEYPKHLTADDTPPAHDPAAVEDARKKREAKWDYENPKAYCDLAWSINRWGLIGDPKKVDRLGPGWCHLPNEFSTKLRAHFGKLLPSVEASVLPRETLSKLDMPVLVIHGTLDRNAPYGAGRDWAMLWRNGRLLTIEGAAHHAWVEDPERVFPAVDRFLRSGEWPRDAERVTKLDPRAP